MYCPLWHPHFKKKKIFAKRNLGHCCGLRTTPTPLSQCKASSVKTTECSIVSQIMHVSRGRRVIKKGMALHSLLHLHFEGTLGCYYLVSNTYNPVLNFLAYGWTEPRACHPRSSYLETAGNGSPPSSFSEREVGSREWKPKRIVHYVLVKSVFLPHGRQGSCQAQMCFIPICMLNRYRWGKAGRSTFEMLSQLQ